MGCEKYYGTCVNGSEDAYCTEIKDLVEYYDRRSKYYKRLFLGLSTVRIVLVSLIPVTALLGKDTLKTAASVVFSSIALIIEGVLSLNHAHDKWHSYRRTCDRLCSEHRLFHARAGEYVCESQAFEKFVLKCEKIIYDEGELWKEYISKGFVNKGEP